MSLDLISLHLIGPSQTTIQNEKTSSVNFVMISAAVTSVVVTLVITIIIVALLVKKKIML